MFNQIRFQTGEIKEIIDEMKKGNIPCMDVDDEDDFQRFVNELSKRNILLAENVPFDRKARDGVKEPEFEFRAAFFDKEAGSTPLQSQDFMFIDFYFEPELEETYDSIMGD